MQMQILGTAMLFIWVVCLVFKCHLKGYGNVS